MLYCLVPLPCFTPLLLPAAWVQALQKLAKEVSWEEESRRMSALHQMHSCLAACIGKAGASARDRCKVHDYTLPSCDHGVQTNGNPIPFTCKGMSCKRSMTERTSHYLGMLIVPRDHELGLQPQLATWVWLVLCRVPQLWHIHKLIACAKPAHKSRHFFK